MTEYINCGIIGSPAQWCKGISWGVEDILEKIKVNVEQETEIRKIYYLGRLGEISTKETIDKITEIVEGKADERN